MTATVTLDAVRDALDHIKCNQYAASDVALLRDYITRQQYTIEFLELRVAELRAHQDKLVMDKEAR